jgi:hypothetical protein
MGEMAAARTAAAAEWQPPLTVGVCAAVDECGDAVSVLRRMVGRVLVGGHRVALS